MIFIALVAICRTGIRLVLLGVAVCAAVLATAQPASAHATLLFTTPAADTADPVAPQVLTLVYNEPVTLADDAITVTSQTGERVGLSKVVVAQQGRTVSAWPQQSLPTGIYTVRWQVTGVDGDLVEGQFRFGVGAAITPAAAGDGASETSWLTAWWRWLLLAGLTFAAGSVAGERIISRARKTRPDLPQVEGWAGIGTLTGAVAATALMVSLSANGNIVFASTPATVTAVQAVAFAVALIANAVRRHGWTILALSTVVVAEAIRSHPSVALPGWGTVAAAVHIAAAAVWVGTLWHVLRTAVAWRAYRGAVWWLISTYARLAIWCVAAVVATGLVNTLVLVPLSTLLSTGYGRLLLAKVGLVAAAGTVAWLARRRLRTGPEQLSGVTGRARAEAGVLAVVLAVTAVLTATAPATSTAAQQFAPAPVGPVLPLGTLAGQIGVSLAASQGQLVVRLSAPRRDDYYQPQDTPPEFRLAARLQPAGRSTAEDVPLDGCGPGCYLARIDWEDGDNVLTLHAASPGWNGGNVTFVVAWPIQPAAPQLAPVLEAMNQAGKVVVYEQVTSDTSLPWPDPTSLTLTGAEYLALQPYSAGIAPQVVQLPATGDGLTRLAIGFPAEGRYSQLTLDTAGRIIAETQVGAKHVTRRQLTYP